MVIKVAEIGINHNGDIEIVKKLIDAARWSGVEYVKFQKRTIDLVYSQEELDKPRESPWGTTTREQKEGLELSKEDYDVIDNYCKQVGIGWFASPWDVESVDFLLQYEPRFLKIPSALITNIELLQKVKDSEVPVILSTGMSTEDEIARAVYFLGHQIEYLLHCTSTYPSKAEELNLSYIPVLKKKYPYFKIGFSDHSSQIIFIPVSVAFGAEMVEFHITLDRAMYGSDQAASIGVQGMFAISNYVSLVEKAVGDGAKVVYDSELPIISKLRRE